VLLTGWAFPWLMSAISSVVLYPVHAVSQWYQVSESALPQYFRARADLLAELSALKQQIAGESGTQSSIRRLMEENMQLRSMVNFGTSTERVVARVIAQPNKLTYDLLQIDKGTNQGLVVGSPVFVGLDTVIGVIVHAAPTYAFVELLTTAGFESTAYIVGPNTFAPIEGMGGGVARVRVPQGVPLHEGDLVLLPSVVSGVYGEIVAIENLPTQPEQFGYVTPPLPLKSILYVSVALGMPAIRAEADIDQQLRSFVQDYFKLDPAQFPVGTSTVTSTSSGSEPETVTTQ
jgi:cell shape-determining protein MreC